jgi:hypothetical protein
VTTPRPWTRTGMRRLRLAVTAFLVITFSIVLAPALMARLTGGTKLTWPEFLELAGTTAVAFAGCAMFWFLLRPTNVRESTPLDDQIVQLRSNLESSSDLIREINAEFQLQAAAAEKIKAEAEQNQRLAELNAEQAQAVKELVESVQNRASRIGGRQQWLFFLAGVLFSVPLGVAGNFVFELVKAWFAAH